MVGFAIGMPWPLAVGVWLLWMLGGLFAYCELFGGDE